MRRGMNRGLVLKGEWRLNWLERLKKQDKSNRWQQGRMYVSAYVVSSEKS